MDFSLFGHAFTVSEDQQFFETVQEDVILLICNDAYRVKVEIIFRNTYYK